MIGVWPFGWGPMLRWPIRALPSGARFAGWSVARHVAILYLEVVANGSGQEEAAIGLCVWFRSSRQATAALAIALTRISPTTKLNRTFQEKTPANAMALKIKLSSGMLRALELATRIHHDHPGQRRRLPHGVVVQRLPRQPLAHAIAGRVAGGTGLVPHGRLGGRLGRGGLGGAAPLGVGRQGRGGKQHPHQQRDAGNTRAHGRGKAAGRGPDGYRRGCGACRTLA